MTAYSVSGYDDWGEIVEFADLARPALVESYSDGIHVVGIPLWSYPDGYPNRPYARRFVPDTWAARAAHPEGRELGHARAHECFGVHGPS